MALWCRRILVFEPEEAFQGLVAHEDAFRFVAVSLRSLEQASRLHEWAFAQGRHTVFTRGAAGRGGAWIATAYARAMRVAARVFRASLLLSACMAVSACKSDKARIGADAPPPAGSSASIAPAASASTASLGDAAGSPDAGRATVYRAFRARNFTLVAEIRGDAVRALLETSGPTASFRGKTTDATHFTLRQANVPRGQKPLTLAGGWSADGATFTGMLTDPRETKATTLSGSAGAFDKAVPTFKSDYEGLLGSHFVRMRIESDGARLTGVYRYARSADDIALAGTVVARDGTFELTESVGGRVTGRFAGVFESLFGVLATWSSPDGAKSLPVELESAQGEYPETVDLGGGLALFPQERILTGDRCTADLVYPQLRGAKDKVKEAALNAALRGDRDTANPCDQAPGEQELPDVEGFSSFDDGYSLRTQKKGRFVSLSQGGSSYMRGAAHPQGGSTCTVIDTQTLTQLRMVDLLTREGRDALGDKVTKVLQGDGPSLSEQGYSGDHIAIGADTSVCLTDTEIHVEFQPYEVAPYFMGAPEASFPKAEVRALFEKSDVTDALFAQ